MARRTLAARYGKFGDGVLFQLKAAKGHWTEKVLHDFGRGNDGRNPHGGLEADGKGNVYGTTANGGTYFSRHGLRFVALQQSGNACSYSFSGGEDGEHAACRPHRRPRRSPLRHHELWRIFFLLLSSRCGTL